MTKKDKDKTLEDWITEIKDQADSLHARIGNLLFDSDPEPDEPSILDSLIVPTHEGNTTRH